MRARDKGCNGLCVTGADVGVPEYGDQIAYPHPSCPVHGDGRKDSDFYPAPGWTQEDEDIYQDYCQMINEWFAEMALDRMADHPRYLGEGEWSDGR